MRHAVVFLSVVLMVVCYPLSAFADGGVYTESVGVDGAGESVTGEADQVVQDEQIEVDPETVEPESSVREKTARESGVSDPLLSKWDNDILEQISLDVSAIRANSDMMIGVIQLYTAVIIFFLFAMWFYKTFIH